MWLKSSATIELYSPGIVIFDPEIMSLFLKENGVVSSNVFDVFLEDEHLGRAAIEQGVVCPIYQIPEDEYSIFFVGRDASSNDLGHCKFSYSGFPLRVKSGVLIVSDLNALFDWDPDFFCNYKDNYENKLLNNDYIEAEQGKYNMTVKGYFGLKPPYTSLGYGLDLKLVEELPDFDSSSSVDDRNFVIEGFI